MDMKVYVTEFDFTDEAGNESKDWHLALDHHCFAHKEACEFIFWLGDGSELQEERLESFKELGFSEDFLAEVHKALASDFKYICLFA